MKKEVDIKPRMQGSLGINVLNMDEYVAQLGHSIGD